MFVNQHMTSVHYNKERYERQKLIETQINGDGNVIDSFVVDRGHRDGAEIHSITDTGLIIIHNKSSGKLVTKLVARPQQIKRYYKDLDKQPPEWLLLLARKHNELGYNE